MGKGGARHYAKPYTDPALLQQVMANHDELLSDLGSYETVSKTGAVEPAGLVRNLALVKGLLTVCPSGSVSPGPLRQALLALLTSLPDMNKTKFNGSTWSNMKAERITLLLSHVRKLAREADSLRICAAKLNGSNFKSLQEAVAMVQLPEEEQPLSKGNPLEKGQPLKKGSGSVGNGDDEVSLDSMGLPKMFDTPSKEASPKQDRSSSSSSRPVSSMARRPGRLLQERSPC